MSATPDWSTPAGLAAIKDAWAAELGDYEAPVAYAVGIASAEGRAGWEFGHVNRPGGQHGLPAVVLCRVLGHDGSSATLPMHPGQLSAAIEMLAPAEACTESQHPNLGDWRRLAAIVDDDPGRRLVAVFVGSLGDHVLSDAEADLRRLL